MLNEDWWRERERNNHNDPGYHRPEKWHDMSDVPVYLRFEATRPSWQPRWQHQSNSDGEPI
jgi:hypothetical protein